MLDVLVSAELNRGEPLRVSHEWVRIPAEVLEPHELVYRVGRGFDEAEPGDYLIAEQRTKAATGEFVIVFLVGKGIFLGRWWLKHGLREVRDMSGEPIPGEVVLVAAVNLIVRLERR